MKALSLLQPWASLVALEAKRWETRSWKMPAWVIGQVIAIHASKRFDEECRALTIEPPFSTPLKESGIVTLGDVPRGLILCTAQIKSCWETEIVRGELSEQELAFGNYSNNRYASELVNVRRLVTPIPARGALGLWAVPPEIEAQFEYTEARD